MDIEFKNGSKITTLDTGKNRRGKRSEVVGTLCVECDTFKYNTKMFALGNYSICEECVKKILNFEKCEKLVDCDKII